MPAIIGKLLAMALALLGPAPADTPKELQLKSGERLMAMSDGVLEDTRYFKLVDEVLAKQYAPLKLRGTWCNWRPDWKTEHIVSALNLKAPGPKDKPEATFVVVCTGVAEVWDRLNSPFDDRQLTVYKDYLNRIADSAGKAKISLILITPPILGEDPETEGNQRLTKYADVMKQVAADKKCICIDAHKIMMAALAKKPADWKGRYLTTDGAHPNDLGNAILAAAVMRAIGVADDKMTATESAVPK